MNIEFEKQQKMNTKTYVFSVTDCENSEKPTIWCQMATDKAVKDQKTAEELVMNYADEHLDGVVELDSSDVEDLAYTMRKNGAAWFDERFCFELTEVNG